MVEVHDHLLGTVVYKSPTNSLEGADLRYRRLRAADLRCANLRGANLSGTDLRFALLAGADITGATYDLATRWPACFDPKAHGALPWWEVEEPVYRPFRYPSLAPRSDRFIRRR